MYYIKVRIKCIYSTCCIYAIYDDGLNAFITKNTIICDVPI